MWESVETLLNRNAGSRWNRSVPFHATITSDGKAPSVGTNTIRPPADDAFKGASDSRRTAHGYANKRVSTSLNARSISQMLRRCPTCPRWSLSGLSARRYGPRGIVFVIKIAPCSGVLLGYVRTNIFFEAVTSFSFGFGFGFSFEALAQLTDNASVIATAAY